VAFPAAGSAFTAARKAGPTTIVTGFRRGDITEANRAFRAALPPAGYTVVRSEVDPADSEVVFESASTSGEVALTQECRSRVRVRITLRPS
jgi:hypothetical protein